MTRSLLIVVIAVVACAAAGRAHADEPPPPVVLTPYTVKPGDGCEKIAARVYGDPAKYVLIHQYNPQLGAMPHHLKPGTVLQLPPDPGAGPDAILTRARGAVEARRPEDAGWEAAKAGMDLFRAWRVGSRASASADITFRDDSLLQMRENTVVVIYGPSKHGARVDRAEAVLESGELRSRMGELAGGAPARAPLLVSTGDAQAELDGGNTLISASPDGTRVANHGARAVKLRGKSKDGKLRAKTVAVGGGMGSKAQKGADPTPPRPLPPAPAWAAGPSTFASLDGASGELSAEWTDVAVAEDYLVEVARDERGEDVLTRVVVPKSVHRFEARELPVGPYWITVATIDADRFEGLPSPARPVMLVAFLAQPPGGEPAPLAHEAMVGGRIVAPAGVVCSVGDAAPASTVVLAKLGPTELRCVDSGGVALATRTIEVVPLPVQIVAADGSPAILKRGAATALVLRAPEKAQVSVQGGEGVVVTMGEGGRFEVAVAADVPDQTELRVVLATDAGEVVVASVAVGVLAGDGPAAEVPGAPRVRRKELGASTGVRVFSDGFDFGNAGAPAPAPLLGVRLGLPIAWQIGMEMQVSLARVTFSASDVVSHDGAMLLSGEALLTVGARRGRVQPFVGAGVAVNQLFGALAHYEGDTSYVSPVLRGGARLRLGPWGGLRGDLVDHLRGDLASSFGVELGAFVAF